MTSLLHRQDYLPELSPAHIYALLAGLQPGEAVPPHIYVADYADNTIPDWRIHSNEESGPIRILVALDMSNQTEQIDLWSQGSVTPAVRILTCPRKTLRCHPVVHNGEWPNFMCDMQQQAKITVRQLARKRHKGKAEVAYG